MLNPRLLAVALAGTSLTSCPAAAQTTAFSSGESVSGMTKQCFYSFGADTYTKTISATSLCPLSIVVPSTPKSPQYQYTSPPPGNITAFKSGEMTSGMTKQCFYSFGANQYTRTISSTALCPLSIQVQ